MAGHTVLITSVLDERCVKLARKARVDLVAYEEDALAPGSLETGTFETRAVSISSDESLFFTWHARVRQAVQRFYDENRDDLIRPVLSINGDERAFRNYFIHWLRQAIEQDYRLIMIGEKYFPDANIIYTFRRPTISSMFLTRGEVLGSRRFCQYLNALKYFGGPVWLLLNSFLAWTRKPKAKPAVALVFEQMYPMYRSNNEFLFFYEYLSSAPWPTLYLFPQRKWELYSELREQDQNILTFRDLHLGPASIFNGIKSWLRISIECLRHRHARRIFQSYFLFLFVTYRYRALLQTVDFRFLLKMRPDMDMFASLIRQELNSKGVGTIGYSHGTYYQRTGAKAVIDFDYFGYSGPNELETLGQLWEITPKTKLICAGQMSADNPVDQAILEQALRELPDECGVGIYPTTHDPHELAITREDMCAFLDIAIRCGSRHAKGRIIVKDKNGEAWLHAYVDECVRRYKSSVIYAYHEPGTGFTLTAADTYRLIDFGIVMSLSTCAFELLALGKKVLVYEPMLTAEHPFEKHTPLLVAHDTVALERNFEAVIKMTSSEYKNYIQPTLAYCGKQADGQLVRSFFHSIDGLGEHDRKADAVVSNMVHS